MIVLALDTTTRTGSIALTRDRNLLAVTEGDPARTHAERLPGAIRDLVRRAGVVLDAVDVFAVATGPGSFTGLRIGLATIQGLAFASRRPVVGVSALDALASASCARFTSGSGVPGPLACLPGPPRWVAGCMDAARGEVFTVLYRVAEWPNYSGVVGDACDPAADLKEEEGPSVATPDIVFARWRSIVVDGALIVAGEGALHYADRLQASLPSAECPEPVPALAPVIARLALRRAAAGGATGPHAIRPVYVRRPDAVLARERRAQAGTDRDPEGRRQ